MDLALGNGTTITLSISNKSTGVPSGRSAQLIASALIKAAEDRVRRLETELVEAKEAEAQFNAQQSLDIAIQALTGLSIETPNNDVEVWLPAVEMQRFESRTLKAAEEESLLDGMKRLGLKKQKGHCGISKKKRYNPRRSHLFIKVAKESIKRAMYEVAAAGVEGEGKKAGEMHLSKVGMLMGKKTAPRLSQWRRGSL